jgi:uncharacterized protein YbaR (Trm112 family)
MEKWNSAALQDKVLVHLETMMRMEPGESRTSRLAEFSAGMKLGGAESLRCISCGAGLKLIGPTGTFLQGEVTVDGILACASCGREYPVVRSIPRFVPSEDYAHSFGYQWNHFDKTQLDSHMGNDLSRERFFATTQWPQRMDG